MKFFTFICHLRTNCSMGCIFSNLLLLFSEIIQILWICGGNFKWAYLKSGILDIITGNKKFWSHFHPEWHQIYRIHCSICVHRKKTPKWLVLLCYTTYGDDQRGKGTYSGEQIGWPLTISSSSKYYYVMSQMIIFTGNLVFERAKGKYFRKGDAVFVWLLCVLSVKLEEEFFSTHT